MIVLFVLILAAAECWAVQPYTPVQPDPVLESWRWRTFPELKGLGLTCMAEDRDGNMWFGVDEGVMRYDGITWTTYTPEEGVYGVPVTALCAARDGSVYAGTSVGISRFRDGTWSRVYPPEGDLPWRIWDLMEASDGSVWAGTPWGALRLDREGPTLYTTEAFAAALRMLAPGHRLSIVPDDAAPDRPWSRPYSFFTGEGIGVGVVSGVISALAPGGPGEKAGLKVGDRVAAVDGEVMDPSASWWTAWRQLFGPAGTSVTLTVEREGQSEPFEVTVTREHVEGIFRDSPVYDVYEDREGTLWFGLWRGKIVRCDIRRTDTAGAAAWRLYTEADGLDIGRWPRIAQTRDGAIWTISGDGYRGVNRFDGEVWTNFRLRDLGGTDINTSILETGKGTLWVGAQRGALHAYRNGAWTVYRPPAVPVSRVRVIGLLETSDGALWVAGRGQEASRLDLGASRWTTYEGLYFQCETPDGSHWFLSQDSTAVRYDGRAWTRYGVEDGLMNAPLRLIATRRGVLWAAGSHDSTAATARFDGKGWSLQTHRELSQEIDVRAVYESSDGALWFGSRGLRKPGQLGGVLRFGGQTWTHYPAGEAGTGLVYGIGQTADGVLWFGGNRLVRFDGEIWTSVTEPEELATPFSDVVYAGPNGDLWVGTRTYGAFHYDPSAGPAQGRGAWTRYDVRDGLANNTINSILQTDDGSVWVATGEGISRFDGRTWTTYALPPDLRVGSPFGGASLRQSGDGAIWINRFVREAATRWVWVTTRYVPDADPPDTEITLSLNQVSQPGNTILAWRGADPWRSTPEGELQYAWRLGGGEWSPFTLKKSEVFLSLSSGGHTFEVVARDRDFNVDPTPAAVQFRVVPPVWQEPWFVGLMGLFVAGIGLQTARVVRRDRRLRESNAALSMANRDLFGLNRGLQQDRAVERVRAEVTAMKSAEDLQEMVAEMLKELVEAGVEFDLCVINILDEEAGIRRQYGATKQGWSGQAEMPLEQVSEDFMAIYKGGKPVVRQVDDVLAEACLRSREHLGLTGEMARPSAVADAPFAYGTLSLQTQKQEGFSEEDVALIGEFARVIALGYARFLDFQLLEAQNRELQRERAVEHIRGQVQAMEQASDFERVLSLLSEDLKGVGLSFDTCGIEVLDEPVAEPTLAHFEEHGYRYTAYTIDPDGTVASNSYHIPAPFRPVDLEILERFIAGEPWKALIGGTNAILEVPASNYGRLRITSSERQDFTEEDIESLQDFASAIALGYARYLDIREIQEQTERKSAFMASMSHEIRTPMNAIIGFTRMVLRRSSDVLPERQQDNLKKVQASADHLLDLINDILDLSKIEAGRMDVDVKPFDVKELISACCGEVEPLVEAKPNVRLNYEVPEGIGQANTDQGRLRQIVINLLSNAIKFTPQGEVSVRVSKDGGTGDKASLIIAVSDTGTGIPADALESIFEEFQQVKGSDPQHKGTGLGLPITKGFAELLGGSISVQSEVGKGSTFTVRVPVVYKEG